MREILKYPPVLLDCGRQNAATPWRKWCRVRIGVADAAAAADDPPTVRRSAAAIHAERKERDAVDRSTGRIREDVMSRLLVRSFALSVDGYGAGPAQDLRHPLGIRGEELMEWFFRTRVWQKMHGQGNGETGIDNQMAEQGSSGIGAWIIGRNMFGPVRGPWPDEAWKGWWGDEPPYHCAVFVLTHHPRPSLRMAGGTEFHFVDGGIHAALASAREAAGGLDVRLGGGVATVREFLQAGLIDEMRIAVRPVVLGAGEHLWHGLNLHQLGYECTRTIAGERATHMILGKRP